MKAIQQIKHTFEFENAFKDAAWFKRALEYAAERLAGDDDNGHMVANVEIEITDANEVTIISKYRVNQFSDLCADAWEYEFRQLIDNEIVTRNTEATAL